LPSNEKQDFGMARNAHEGEDFTKGGGGSHTPLDDAFTSNGFENPEPVAVE